MTIVILSVLLIVGFELLWSVPVLRPHRRHFRAMLALFWVAVLTIFAVDRLNLASRFFFEGIPRFASDAATYQDQARVLASALRDGVFADFAGEQYFHYSRVLAILYLVFGEHPLTGGIFNAVFYLSSVMSVFLIGRQLFSDRAGLIAAWLFALMPTFLLHDTQTLRWAMTTAGLHVATCGVLMLTGRSWWAGGLFAVLGFGILVYDLPYVARLFTFALIACGCLALLHRFPWRTRLLTAGKICGFALIAATWYHVTWERNTVMVEAVLEETALEPALPLPLPQAAPVPPPRVDDLIRSVDAPTAQPIAIAVHRPEARATGGGWRSSVAARLDALIAPVLLSRRGFIGETQGLLRDGNSVGTTLAGGSLRTFGDFLRNLPTAYRVALVEPTIPRLLDRTTGSSGVGRFAAVEMIFYYVVTALAFAGLFIGFRPKGLSRLQLVFIVILTAGTYALMGTTVLNGGTLHRLRQPYVAFHCVLAAGALAWGWERRGARGAALEPTRKNSFAA